MNIEALIKKAAAEAVTALYGTAPAEQQIQLQKTKKEYEGHLTLVVFPFLKLSRKRPDETAAEIGAWLAEHCPAVAKFNAVGGFLNLCIAPETWTRLLAGIDAQERYGIVPVTDFRQILRLSS